MTSDFESVFVREFQSVSRTVYLLCRDRQRAEEITQDAFVEALRRWDRISEYDRPGAWVRRVAIRMAVRGLRRDQRRARAEQDTGKAQAIAAAGEPGEVFAAIRRLSRHQQAAVVLYYYEDMSPLEIADIIGCSPATARVHLHRGRTRLAELLGKEVSDELR